MSNYDYVYVRGLGSDNNLEIGPVMSHICIRECGSDAVSSTHVYGDVV